MRYRYLLIILALLIAFGTARAKKAYEFTLKDLDGNTVNLSDHRGKVILLDFWGTWCPPCRRALPYIVSLHNKYSGEDFILIGVNVERSARPWQVKDFLERYEAEYLNVLGDQRVLSRYGIIGFPTTVLIDQNMNEVKRYIGITPQAEKELDNKISKLLQASRQPLDVCIGFIKASGEGADPGLSDTARRAVYKSLAARGSRYNVQFSMPDQQPDAGCRYHINGSLSVNGKKGRLTLKLIDSETELEIDSATGFGDLEDIESLSSNAADKLSSALDRR
jgi:thiol-disulfide isomerase/thioredoxin